ncbi:acyltransferase family protein [Mesorhizobium sp. ORM6]
MAAEYPPSPWLFTLAGVPKIGVWLFFALSAFLLSTQLITQVVPLREYIIGRLLRILPPFVAAIIFYRLVGTLGIDSWSSVWQVMVVPIGHLWTIPAELSFYLFLPFVVAAILFVFDRVGTSSAIVLLIFIAGVAALIWPPLQTTVSAPWCGWYAINFLSGVGAALLAAKFPRPPSATVKAIGAISLAGIVGFIVLVELRVFGDDRDILLNKHFIIGPLWAVIVYAVFAAPPRFLTVRPMVLIGRWSFSIYLFHWGIVVWAGTLLPAPLAFFIGLVGSIGAGYLGYRFIERPTYAVRHWLNTDQSAAAAVKRASI